MKIYALANKSDGQITGYIETNDPTIGLPSEQVLIDIDTLPEYNQIIEEPREFKVTRGLHGKYIIYKKDKKDK